MYHALLQERDDKNIDDVVISRVEQISPFPYDLVRVILLVIVLVLTSLQLTPHLDKYPNADIVWCQVSARSRQLLHYLLTFSQEEPLNNGAWTYVGPRILTAANQTEHHKGKYPLYAGRDPTSSVATGSKVRCCRHSACSTVADGTQAMHKKQIEAYLATAFGQ